MIIPDRVKVEKMEALAKEVMYLCRDTLAVKLRFINPALSRLDILSSLWPMATDGEAIYYDPVYVLHCYGKEKTMPMHSYLHSVLHCIFQHFYVNPKINSELWSLASDMAVENMITELNLDGTRMERETEQQEALEPIRKAVGQLTAEKIYHYLVGHRPKEDDLIHLSRLFWCDEHEAWYIASVTDEEHEFGERSSNQEGDAKEGNTGKTDPDNPDLDRMSEEKRQIRDRWEEIAQQMEVELQTFAKKTGDTARGLMQNLQEVNRERYDYGTFLKKFASLGEVMQVNDDEFDYIFYTYGLNLYKKIPLIEPLEYKETKRIREFVIAIDTSGSVSGELVQNFVQKTYNILMQQENFFNKINLHIIMCDAVIQEDVKITNKEEFDRYLAGMELKGSGGTDFRPVFRKVDAMIHNHEFINLKGLIYFTDGKGTYPERQPGYQTAFIFVQDDYRNADVPPWAIQLVLQKYELE